VATGEQIGLVVRRRWFVAGFRLGGQPVIHLIDQQLNGLLQFEAFLLLYDQCVVQLADGFVLKLETGLQFGNSIKQRICAHNSLVVAFRKNGSIGQRWMADQHLETG